MHSEPPFTDKLTGSIRQYFHEIGEKALIVESLSGYKPPFRIIIK